jgi:glycerophosphoryl diester phosphodiesterase
MTRRRTALTIASVAVVLAAGSTTATLSTSAYAEANCAENLTLVAYQGGGGFAPENTVSAFANSVKHKPDQIQVDVRLTFDGVPVLVHDGDLQRTTNIAKIYPKRRNDPISSFTYEELKKLDAGSWFDARFAGEPIARLHDVLGYTYPYGIGISIFPQDMAETPGLGAAISDELNSDARWAELLEAGQIEFGSSDLETLRTMAALQPKAKTLWAPTEPSSGSLTQNAEWVDEIGQEYQGFEPSEAVPVHNSGMAVALFGVDGPDGLSDSLTSGADKIFTDYPDVLNAICADEDPITAADGITVSEVESSVDGSDVKVESGEYVVLTNTGKHTVDVSGYYIRNSTGRKLIVGEGYMLPPGDELRVYTGTGTSSLERFYNEQSVNLLDNTHDTLAVYNPTDDCVDMFVY